MTAFACLALLAVSAAEPSIARLSAADVAPACVPSDDRDFLGSMHAGSIYEQPLLVEPTAKERQALSCGGKMAVVLWMLLPSEKTSSMLAFFGGRLWGEPGPSAMHTDELLWAGDVIAIVSSPGEREVVETLAARLEKLGYRRYRARAANAAPSIDRQIAAEVDCGPGSSDPLRLWCPASRIAGAHFTAPAKPEVYLGLTVAVPGTSRFREAAARGAGVAILALGGGKAYLGSLDPDDDSERKDLVEVAARVTAALEGRKGAVRVPGGLGEFLDSIQANLPAKGTAVSAGRFAAVVPVRIYFVAGAPVGTYVVVEDGADAHRVNVFPAVAPSR